MARPSEVLHRDKVVWRAGLPLLGTLSVVELGAGAALLATGLTGAAPPAIMFSASAFLFAGGALLGFCAATLTVLRTVVTRRDVRVQYGLWGPTIPLSMIESVEVADYPIAPPRFGACCASARSPDATATEPARARATQERAPGGGPSKQPA